MFIISRFVKLLKSNKIEATIIHYALYQKFEKILLSAKGTHLRCFSNLIYYQ